MLEQEREWHSEALRAKDEELHNLRDEIDRQLAEYRDLLDIKVALDLENAAKVTERNSLCTKQNR